MIKQLEKNMMTKEQYKLIRLTALGGALEFYDFTIYALFAPYISNHFFSNANHFISLINTFLVFALGYLARPLGGFVFGYMGDKLGRKSAFTLSVFIMAIATLLIGCLPDYQSIGMLAPIALILLRLLQGFSVGGEIPGAAVFIFEHVSFHKHGFAIGILFMSITLGNSLGSLVGMVLTLLLNQEQMMAWGWRLPFIIGFILGIISYIIRKKTFETPVFVDMMQQGRLQKNLLKTLKSFRVEIGYGILLTAISSSIITLFLYLPTYLSIIAPSITATFQINIINFLSFALATAFFGWLSDYINRIKLLALGALLLMICSYVLFVGLSNIGIKFIWIFSLGFAIIGGMVNGSYVVMLAGFFPASIRNSGVAVSYSFGIALFSGIAPIAFTWLLKVFNFNEAPVFYIIACSILTLVAILRSPTALMERKEEGVTS